MLRPAQSQLPLRLQVRRLAQLPEPRTALAQPLAPMQLLGQLPGLCLGLRQPPVPELQRGQLRELRLVLAQPLELRRLLEQLQELRLGTETALRCQSSSRRSCGSRDWCWHSLWSYGGCRGKCRGCGRG